MAAIYLRHPVHGEKVACGDLEAQMDRANGWVDFDPVARLPAFLNATSTEPVSDLPADFPGRKELIAAGFPMWASLVGKNADELQAIKGIGPVTATSIVEAMDS